MQGLAGGCVGWGQPNPGLGAPARHFMRMAGPRCSLLSCGPLRHPWGKGRDREGTVPWLPAPKPPPAQGSHFLACCSCLSRCCPVPCVLWSCSPFCPSRRAVSLLAAPVSFPGGVVFRVHWLASRAHKELAGRQPQRRSRPSPFPQATLAQGLVWETEAGPWSRPSPLRLALFPW